MKKISSKWIKIASLIALPTLTMAAISPVIVSCSSDNGGGNKNQVASDKWIIKDYCKYNNPSTKVQSIISQQQYDFMVNGNSMSNGNYLIDDSCEIRYKPTQETVKHYEKFATSLRFINVEKNSIAIGYQQILEIYESDNPEKRQYLAFDIEIYTYDESSSSWTCKSSTLMNSYLNFVPSPENNITMNFIQWLKQINTSNFETWPVPEEDIKYEINNTLACDVNTWISDFYKFIESSNDPEYEYLSYNASYSNCNIDWNNIPKLN